MRYLRRSQRGIVLKGLLFVVPAISAVMAATWPRSGGTPRSCVSASADQAVRMLSRATPSIADRRAIELASSAQQKIESWITQERAQLSRPRGIAVGDLGAARLAGADNEIRRVRDVYAWIATSPALTRALLVLADTN